MLAPPQAPQGSCRRKLGTLDCNFFCSSPCHGTQLSSSQQPSTFPSTFAGFSHPCRQPPSISSKTHDGAAQALSAPAVKMATTSNMFMYSLTIQPPSTVTQAIVGQFSGTKEQQIMTACGTRLSLLKPDPTQGKVITILSHDVFGIIRSIAAFRLAGSNKGKLPSHLRIPPS